MAFRTRFAPSPTGYLHVGGARTALYCWLQAKKLGGTYVLRIEDTDRERSTQEAVDAILDSLDWLGLTADEGPVFQSDRLARYAEVTESLLANNHAYYCSCTKERLDDLREAQRNASQKPKYDGHCRELNVSEEKSLVVRFKSPLTGQTDFDDLIRGIVSFNNEELDDLVIRRSDGTPTYNLAVTIDDADMSISHVIRGDDHINNTPKQVNIFKAMGVALPKFAHLPMILGADGKRLSKRHGAASVGEFQLQGFLPEALLNYLVRLGWSHGDEEIFSLEKMIELFDLADVNRAASTFNMEKLLWLNQQYIIAADPGRLAQLLVLELQRRDIDYSAGPDPEQVVRAYKERANTMVEMVDNSLYLFQDFAEFDPAAAKKHLRRVAIGPMSELRERLSNLSQWSDTEIDRLINSLLQELDLKLPKLAQPLRVAVTGNASSPSISTTLALVGKTRALHRMDRALSFMEARPAA